MLNVFSVAALGMLTALEIVLSRFLSVATPFLKISFAFVPIALSGMIWGPAAGALVGALGDLIGALLFPIGAYYPGFTLTAALVGAVYGFMLHRKKVKIWHIATACVVVNMLCNFGLDSYWLYRIMGAGVIAQLPTRAIKSAIMSVICTAILCALAPYRDLFAKPFTDREKKRLRAALKKKKTAMSAKELKNISGQITERTLSLIEIVEANTVFCFVGTADEVDTSSLIDTLLSLGKRVCVPRCEQDGSMTARVITSRNELESGRFGILAPSEQSEIVEPADIDAALLPAMGFDKKGMRLGRGKAYYDRYLDGCDAPLIGLCPSALLVNEIPFMSHDKSADIVVCENKIIICKR